MNKLSLLGVSAVVGCCIFEGRIEPCTTVVSPDGRNEIWLWTNPLAYEVRHGGEVVVAKSEIGMKVGGKCLGRVGEDASAPKITTWMLSGTAETPVYKKERVDLSGNEAFVDFGDCGIRIVARNDGVAYRFETKLDGEIIIDAELANVSFPSGDVKCALHATRHCGCEKV